MTMIQWHRKNCRRLLTHPGTVPEVSMTNVASEQLVPTRGVRD